MELIVLGFMANELLPQCLTSQALIPQKLGDVLPMLSHSALLSNSVFPMC